MADTRNEWTAERRGERTEHGWFDDRGVSEVIGSILVFGLLVSLLAIVQTQAVPDANNEVEVKHNGDLQGDMANLQAAITRSAIFGGSESTVVETGMTYPPRLVLYNPPSVQGTLQTTEESGADLVGFQALDEDTNDRFVDQSTSTFRTLTFPTHSIRYRPDYNRYENAPTTTYEYTALVNRFDDGQTTVQSKGTLVDGNRISLVLVDGGLQETGVRPASVTTYPVSAPAQTVEVETVPGVQGRLALPTRMSEETWVSKILDGQIDDNAIPSGTDPTSCDDIGVAAGNAEPKDGKYIVNCVPQGFGNDDPSDNQIVLFFEADKSYRLRTAKVGFNAGVEEPPAYLTRIQTGEAGEFEVEVRDQFSNPVDSKEEIKVDHPTPSGGTTTTDLFTDTNGRVSFSTPLRSGTVTFYDASLYTPGSGTSCDVAPACVEYDLGQMAGSGGPPVELSEAAITDDNEVTLQVRNLGTEDRQISKVKLNYVTVYEKKTAAGDVDLIGSALATLGLDITQTDVTDVIDGPNGMNEITVGSGSSVNPGVTENEGPAQLSGTTLSPIPTGSTESVALVFDENFNADTSDGNFESGDAVHVSVTVTYLDGRQETYETQLHVPNDDDR